VAWLRGCTRTAITRALWPSSRAGENALTGEPFYTRDVLAEAIARNGYEIGDWTYSVPVIWHWGENTTLQMGRYCSIADNVQIFLGGNHRIDWVTTYPF
jgi:hypothetical protein